MFRKGRDLADELPDYDQLAEMLTEEELAQLLDADEEYVLDELPVSLEELQSLEY